MIVRGVCVVVVTKNQNPFPRRASCVCACVSGDEHRPPRGRFVSVASRTYH